MPILDSNRHGVVVFEIDGDKYLSNSCFVIPEFLQIDVSSYILHVTITKYMNQNWDRNVGVFSPS